MTETGGFETNFSIVPANHTHRETLANLMQFYIYDFSEFLDFDVEENGQYSPYPLDEYFQEGNRQFAYVIKREEKYAGFVLVRLIEDVGVRHYSIAEFFVLKKYRREGIGKAELKKGEQHAPKSARFQRSVYRLLEVVP